MEDIENVEMVEEWSALSNGVVRRYYCKLCGDLLYETDIEESLEEYLER